MKYSVFLLILIAVCSSTLQSQESEESVGDLHIIFSSDIKGYLGGLRLPWRYAGWTGSQSNVPQ
jgi:hypothetical protein